MAGVNFSGLASGLDTDLIIQSLLVNRQKRIDNINDAIDSGETKKRALSDVKSSLSRFQDILTDFTDEVFNNRTVETTDSAVVTAEADGDSSLGEHEIIVNQLASRSAATFGQVQSSATDIIGAGTMTVNLQGGESFSVSLTDGASTLSDLKTAINDEHGESLQASIIEVNTGQFQLVVSTKNTGADYEILDDGDAGASSLSNFSGGFLGGITTEQTGQDASFSIDGINITRSVNEVDDVLEGVTLTLRGAGSSNLNVDTDLDQVTDQFDEMAKAYNDVLSQIGRVTNRETGGVLAGDSDLIGLKGRLQGFITRFVPNIDKINERDDGSTGFTSLSMIGFKSDSKTGDLTLNKSDLKEALEDHFDEVKALFMGGSTTDDPNITLNSNTTPFSGSITLDTLSATKTATIDGSSENLDESGSILSFASTSDYSGMTFIAGSANSSATIEVAAGLGKILDSELERYTSFSGILADRTTTIDSRKRSLEKDLERSEDRLESERFRLTQVFAKAEQAISTLQGLQSSLGAQTIQR